MVSHVEGGGYLNLSRESISRSNDRCPNPAERPEGLKDFEYGVEVSRNRS
jgi:hypothetical protein